jgi:hypothetical protein
MTIWQPLRFARAVLTVTVVLGGMAFAATPVGATATPGPKCGPKTVTAHAAPGVGNQELFTVGSAGTVTVRQESNTTLRVTDADARPGWKDEVIARESTRPHVGFQRLGVPDDQERFWARLNTSGTPGTVVNVVIQSCT